MSAHPPWLIVTHGRGLSNALRRILEQSGRSVAPPIIAGRDWSRVVAKTTPRRLILGLHNRVSLDEIARVADAAGDVIGLVAGRAEQMRSSAGALPFSAVAPALGVAAAPTIEAVAAAAELVDRGLDFGPRVVGIAAPDGGARDLLRAAFSRAGLRASPTTRALVTVGLEGIRWGRNRTPFSSAHLAALACLGETDRAPARSATRRSRARMAAARSLLDVVPGPLGEMRTRNLLRLWEVGASQDALALSATAAVRHARRLGYPIRLRAVGPSLEGVDLPGTTATASTAAEVRAAFTAILHAAAAAVYAPRVDGVLLTRHSGDAVDTDIVVTFAASRALIYVAGRRVTAGSCPLVRGRMARLLDATSATGPARRPMRAALRALSNFASEMHGRIAWLRVCLRPVGDSVQLVEASAAKR